MLAPEIFTPARVWPSLGSAHRNRGHLKNFKGQHLKLGLKFYMHVYSFGGSGRNLRKFYQQMWLIAGVIKWTLILQGVQHTKLGRVKKRQKFIAIFNNFRVWSQISPEWIDISKIRKVLGQLHFIPYWAKKIWCTLVHKPNSYKRACWPTKLHFFRKTIFRPLGGAGPSNFLHALDTGQGSLAHTTNRVGVPQKF